MSDSFLKRALKVSDYCALHQETSRRRAVNNSFGRKSVRDHIFLMCDHVYYIEVFSFSIET